MQSVMTGSFSTLFFSIFIIKKQFRKLAGELDSVVERFLKYGEPSDRRELTIYI